MTLQELKREFEIFTNKISEHVNSCQIIVTTKDDDGEEIIWPFGVGSWFARYGSVKDWIISQEESTKIQTRKREESND